jgi:hypothetical protein
MMSLGNSDRFHSEEPGEKEAQRPLVRLERSVVGFVELFTRL